MLPKKNRLPLRTEFKRIKGSGRLYQGKLFSLAVTKQTGDLPSRFGIIVSNKINKKATSRNRLRRQLYEAVYQLLPQIKPSFDGIFLVKKAMMGSNLTEITLEAKKLFYQAGII